MTKRVIANPPIGIYTNKKTNLGLAFFIILLDVIARYKKSFQDEEIIFPSRSYNTFGKRADKLIEKTSMNSSDIKNTVYSYIRKDEVRKQLNLSSSKITLDDEPVIREGIKEDFLKLRERGYLIEKEKSFYLDCQKIKERINLKKIIEEIKCFPKRAKKELNRFTEELESPVKLTRPRKHSVENPLGGNKIGPLFVIANLWNHKYPNANYTFACSNNTLCKYTFLRILTRAVLEREAGMDELVVWPRLIPKGGMKGWSLKNIIEDEYHADMLRYALMHKYSKSHLKVKINKSMLKGGKKFVYLITNLRKPLSGSVEEVKEPHSIYPDYKQNMNNLRFQRVLSNLKKKLKEISKELNKINRKNTQKMDNLRKKYLSITDMLYPFLPATCNLAKSEVCGPPH